MTNFITKLDDRTAEMVLQRISRSIMNRSDINTELSPKWQETIQGYSVDTMPTATNGDLARAALSLLAEDPAEREKIRMLVENPAPQGYDFGATIGIVTAAIVVLQVHFEIEKTAEGWKIKVGKNAASDKLLRDFVGMLKGLLGKD
jgi:hypothetical protein